MAKGKEKEMTAYQKLAKRKVAKFKRAFAETSKKREQVPTVQASNDQDESQDNENQEIEGIETQNVQDDGASQGSNTPEETSGKRGPTKISTLKARLGGEKRVVNFNEKGQPIGANSNIYSSYLGGIARDRVPISFPTWHTVPKDMKDKFWTELTKRFIVPEFAKKLALKTIGKDWRGYKVRLRKSYYDPYNNNEDRIAARPKEIKLDDWKMFIAYVSKDEYQIRRKKAKEAIKNNKLPHTCSRKGYARLEDEMKRNSDGATPITRVDVWIKAHRKPSGEPINEFAKETIDKLNETPSSINCGKDDALSQVLGPDPNGRLRGVGFGVTASTLFGVNQCLGRVNHMEEKYQNVLEELSSLRKLVAKTLTQEPNHSSTHPFLETLQGHSTQSNRNMNMPNHSSDQAFHKSAQRQQSTFTDKNKTPKSGGVPLKVVPCKLFRLVPEDVVATGYWYTDDPNTKLHNGPLGTGYSKVSIDVALQEDALLVRRPEEGLQTIGDAVGSFIAWPTNSIIKE